MMPQSPRHVHHSSNVMKPSPSFWHVTKAPLMSSHERLLLMPGTTSPVIAGVGWTVRSSVTGRGRPESNSAISVQKTSMPRSEPAPSTSPPTLPNWSLVPVMVVASLTHADSKCALSAAERLRSASRHSGSFSTIFLYLKSASRLALTRMFFCSIESRHPGSGSVGSLCPTSPSIGLARARAIMTRHSKNSAMSSELLPCSAVLPSVAPARLSDLLTWNVSSTWSARKKMLLMRFILKSSVASSQSSAMSVSSVCWMVIAESAEPEPAEPLLAYWAKIDFSSPKDRWKMPNISSSHSGKPYTCERSILDHVLMSALCSASS
mmetsp:Transcript_27250/g.54862  ORF Transcript_27250/g.54862 Transcript_27250/m.54862 type:complete len:321 (-) Transcript_27250:2273-3235(-)